VTLRVIGAGVGRTGTFSMKQALDQLGFGPCHHMEEVDETSPREVGLWMDAARGKADWSVNYAGYHAAVDWPTAAFWRELSEAFPDAKLLLTVRDPEAWCVSFSNTIYPLIEAAEQASPEERPFLEMVTAVVTRTGFRIPSTRDEIIAAFNRHVAAVKATIPPERLLVFDVREGWAPLCAYLGVPLLEADFPRTNNTEEFWKSTQAPPRQ
jgi:hypothetical protein